MPIRSAQIRIGLFVYVRVAWNIQGMAVSECGSVVYVTIAWIIIREQKFNILDLK